MRQPREEIGRMATRSLIDLIEGIAGSEPLHVVLTSELVVRQSTRDIR
jgi:LacI family repressor for deo operon, udp, cdd, tsx, nupC, and nupG